MIPVQDKSDSGFTLIQMSIALIIIGLLVGGVLAGQNLIQAAAISAQISQISKYQQAVINFQNKYNGYLPGDIPNPAATQFGFQSRGAFVGEGDGNGVIEGNCANVSNVGGEIIGFDIECGELAVFWEDLSEANLLDVTVYGEDTKGYRYPKTTGVDNTINFATTPPLSGWLPTAKLGGNNFVYIFSVNRTNYFAVSTVSKLSWYVYGASNPGITVQQAYNIDMKIDDGLPQSGSVTACYVNENVGTERGVSAAGGGLQGANGGANCVPTTTATAYATTNCYDNNNVAGTQAYSISQNANAQNCALSFQFGTQ